MVATAIRSVGRERSAGRSFSADSGKYVERRAQELVAEHSHFRGHANDFQFAQRDDVLVVHGCVPSFYLKQLLQTVLGKLDGVRWVDNQVDVVACDGLSSVREW